MIVFLSYGHSHRNIAEKITLALKEHQVFFDSYCLPPGHEFDERIREGVREADALIFLISPDSVRKGSYARTELKYARDKWPEGQRVFPVMVEPTELEQIPNDLAMLNILEPEGNIPAEVAYEFQKWATAVGIPTPGSSERSIANKSPIDLSKTATLGPICLPAEPPSLPPGYLSRPEYLSAVGSVMAESEPARPRLRLIVGESGVGKSVLAVEFFHAARRAFKDTETSWIDCRVTFQLPEEANGCRLIVFDNVTDNHPMIEANWVSGLRDSIIILTTTSERVVNKVRGATGTMDYEPALIKMESFTSDEVNLFATRNIPPDHVSFAVRKALEFGRLPVVLQLLRELCLDESITDAALDSSGPAGLRGLLNHWLLARDEKGTLTTVVEVLATIPFVGMDTEALAEVAELFPEEVDEVIDQLKRVGLVTPICVPVIGGVGTVLVMHESVRRLYEQTDSSAKLSRWQRSYLNLLERRLSSPQTNSNDVLTVVDAWVGGWKQVFDLSLDVDHATRYQHHMSLLEKVVQSESGLWMLALNSIPQFLRGLIQDPGEESCAIVIGISHIVSKLKGNKALANAIWLGCRNPDSWARGAAIAAAVSQWKKLGGTHQQYGKDELNQWLKYAYQMYDREAEMPLNEGNWNFAVDFDLLAAVCGLVRLDNLNEALKAVRSPEFEQRCRSTGLAHLALIVLLCEHGVLHGNNSDDHRSAAFLDLAHQWARGVLESPTRIQHTGYRVSQYVQARYGVEIPDLRRTVDPGRAPSFALDVARMCDSEGLINFVAQAEDGPTYYL